MKRIIDTPDTPMLRILMSVCPSILPHSTRAYQLLKCHKEQNRNPKSNQITGLKRNSSTEISPFFFDCRRGYRRQWGRTVQFLPFVWQDASYWGVYQWRKRERREEEHSFFLKHIRVVVK